jgi:SAM-dependent methyltransferase
LTGSVPDITRKRYRELLSTLEPYRKNNRMLDVGCGEGFFLSEAKSVGWEVHGTEFSEIYLPICRAKGIEMRTGRLDASNYPNGSFDVIAWIEVIEHIDHPQQELEKMFQLLRPGGVVYVTTPNFNSVSRRVLRGNWTVIDYPGHLVYYTPDTLRRLFKRNGFEPIRIKTDGISPGRLKDGLRGRSSGDHGFHTTDREWQTRLERNTINRSIKRLANGALSLTGAGDNLKALFMKPVTAK